MSEIQTVIIMQIITLVVSAIAPIISSLSYFLSHIQRSKCCFGGEIIMRKDSKQIKPLTSVQINDSTQI